MALDGPGDLRTLLRAARSGDKAARAELEMRVHNELCCIAPSRAHPVQPAALLNEACVRLLAQGTYDADDRRQVVEVASEVVRWLRVDHARASTAAKQGEATIAPLSTVRFDIPLDSPDLDEVLAVDEALGRLKTLDRRLVRVFELRYFAGMSEEEVADALGLRVRTVIRDWYRACYLVRQELRR